MLTPHNRRPSHASVMAFTTAVVLAMSSLLSAQGQAVRRPAPPERSPVAAKMLDEARRMIGEFKITRYTHKTHIDRKEGVCEVDCSGFLVAILKQVAPEHLALIPTEHKRPVAEDFYRVIATRRREGPRAWVRIRRVSDARPGDVIAWLKLERQPGDNTGHVMLIGEQPVMESRRRARVRIVDSTLHGHGEDTRPPDGSGIGEGTIWLTLDSEGHPVGYHWKSRTGLLHEAPIAIGRAVPIEN